MLASLQYPQTCIPVWIALSYISNCGFTVGLQRCAVVSLVTLVDSTRNCGSPVDYLFALWRVSVMESWVDIGADELTFNSAGRGRISLMMLRNLWFGSRIVWLERERGRPETLLHRLTCKMSAKRAPGPGAIRKVEWQPLRVSSLACFKVSICLNCSFRVPHLHSISVNTLLHFIKLNMKASTLCPEDLHAHSQGCCKNSFFFGGSIYVCV